MLYGKEYAKVWIKNTRSSKDIFRIKYLEPYLRREIKSLNKNAAILDVGCGWGTIIPFLKKTHRYVGIDKTKEFLQHIRKKFKQQNIKVEYGYLPSNIDVPAQSFDLVICSMTLHTTPKLKSSLKMLFSKLKPNGKLVIADFSDNAEPIMRKSFNPIYEMSRKHIQGIVLLPSGLKVHAEIFFHKEAKLEKLFAAENDSFKKCKLGPLFIAYDIRKK